MHGRILKDLNRSIAGYGSLDERLDKLQTGESIFSITEDVSQAKEISISSNVTFTGDYTFSCDVRFQKGGMFIIPTGITVTINGRVYASESQQIFSCTGTGKVDGLVNCKIHPEWWGVVGDDLTNNSAKLIQVVSYSKTNFAKKIEFGDGNFIFDGEVALDRNCANFHIYGGRDTHIKLKPNAVNGTIFVIGNYADNNISNIVDIEFSSLKATGAATAAATSWFIHSWMNVGGEITGLKLHDLELDHFKTSGMSIEHANAKIYNIESSYNTLHGFSVETGTFDISHINNHHNTLYGIDFGGGDVGLDTGVAVCDHVYCCENGYGLKTAGVWDLNLSNAHLYKNVNEGITKTVPGGTFNFTNVITRENGSTGINCTAGDGTEVFNLTNVKSYSDNKVTKSNNGSLFFASTIGEVNAVNVHVYDSGRTGINSACKNVAMSNVSINGNGETYAMRLTGGLKAFGLRIHNNTYGTGMLIDTKENVQIYGTGMGDKRPVKTQTKGIEIAATTTGKIVIEEGDFSLCSVGTGIDNAATAAKVEIRGCVNSGNYDQKRIQVTALPTTGCWRKGDIAVHVDASAGDPAEWQCTGGGVFGALAGVTASIKTGSKLLVVNTIAGLYVDCTVAVVGVAGGLRLFRVPDAVAATTVNGDSQTDGVLHVAAITNFKIGDKIVIGRGTAREEEAIIIALGAGTITIATNLVNVHLASDADTVENAIELADVVASTVTAAATTYVVPTLVVKSTLAA